MKKIIALVLLLTLVCTLFTGCIFTCDACDSFTIGTKHEAAGYAVCDDCWDTAMGYAEDLLNSYY